MPSNAHARLNQLTIAHATGRSRPSPSHSLPMPPHPLHESFQSVRYKAVWSNHRPQSKTFLHRSDVAANPHSAVNPQGERGGPNAPLGYSVFRSSTDRGSFRFHRHRLGRGRYRQDSVLYLSGSVFARFGRRNGPARLRNLSNLSAIALLNPARRPLGRRAPSNLGSSLRRRG